MLDAFSTGQHPFVGDSVPEIVHHVLRTEPRKVGQIHPQLSAFFEETVHTRLRGEGARADVDDETRTAMHTNLRVNRGIMAACNAESGAGGAAGA